MVIAPNKDDRHKHRISIGGNGITQIIMLSERWENVAAITTMLIDTRADEDFDTGSVITESYVQADGQDVTDRAHTPTKTIS